MISITATYAISLKEKLVGLIGKKNIEPSYFETRFGIHTFGVKQPIDVLILDNNDTIIQIKRNLKPNHIFFWNPKYKRVLELPQGSIAEKNITKGKRIQILLQ